MRKTIFVVVVLAAFFLAVRGNSPFHQKTAVDETPSAPLPKGEKEIRDVVKAGETLFDIFKKYDLEIGELFELREASANVYPLRNVHPDRPYRIRLDEQDQIRSFDYWFSDDDFLSITRTDTGFHAEKVAVPYEKRVLHLGGVVENNLIASMGEGRENLLLAFQVSDIFAWDIDFSSDLRRGDQYKVVVEGLYLDGEFRKYGDVLSAEFTNQEESYRGYRFEDGGSAGYFDEKGRSLKKAFLKAPLSFRRISSGFSKNRYHPVLKIYRPHHGLDYAAPRGTPVSAVGDGTVLFTGTKGGYGKVVILKHSGGYKTTYGHLSRMASGIRKGKKVDQGEVIAYVGSTGIATGPHLHYEIRIHDRPVNPLTFKIPRKQSIPESRMAEFQRIKSRMDTFLASIRLSGPVKGDGSTL